MKKFLFLTLALVSGNIFSQAKIQFSDTKKNFGFVKKGELVELEYPFKNIGNEPLIISTPKVECSCTTVEIPEKPITPGSTGIIKVKFNTATVYDRQDRTVEIPSNAQNGSVKIRYKGVVKR